MQCFAFKTLSKHDSILQAAQKRWFLHTVLQSNEYMGSFEIVHMTTAMCKATKKSPQMHTNSWQHFPPNSEVD